MLQKHGIANTRIDQRKGICGKMKKEMKESLWEAYLKVADLTEQQKKNLQELGKLFFENTGFLYRIYPLIGKSGECLEDEESGAVYEPEEDLYILRKGKNGIFLKAGEMKALLADMIDLFEEILPLGSVVDLRKEKLSETMDVSKVQQFRVVITKRFIGTGTGCYYPYGAVVYPLGTAGAGKLLSFTPALIEKLVYKGYSDEVEEAFLFQMKKQLIIGQRRKSAGFAERHEMEEQEKKVRRMEEQDG